MLAADVVCELDGLALSSRNARLSPEQRRVAPRLAEILSGAVERLRDGTPAEETLTNARKEITDAGYDQVEYLEPRGDVDLAPTAAADRHARLLVAAWLGETRLIDNKSVRPKLGPVIDWEAAS